jgi:hypothetical protein
MPNFERTERPAAVDLDIAARVMDTVQRQVASYKSSLETLMKMREELREPSGQRKVSTPQALAELLQERGIPQPLSKAMAAEDFQDAQFEAEASLWTWDCCCTDCCLTCQMATQVTGCPDTFIF